MQPMKNRHYIDQTQARYRLAASTDYPFHERLVHFWTNHFAVSADKQPMPAIAGLYENEAIRPNITGNFADLLIACEQHPASGNDHVSRQSAFDRAGIDARPPGEPATA
jgi:uncharacterized protein (DUF1800 family)